MDMKGDVGTWQEVDDQGEMVKLIEVFSLTETWSLGGGGDGGGAWGKGSPDWRL